MRICVDRVGGGELDRRRGRRAPSSRRRPGLREAGCLAEVADQQPLAGALGIVALGVGERDLVGAALQRRDRGSVGGGERDRIGSATARGRPPPRRRGDRAARPAAKRRRPSLERAAEALRRRQRSRARLGGAPSSSSSLRASKSDVRICLRCGPRLRGRVAPATAARGGMGARREQRRRPRRRAPRPSHRCPLHARAHRLYASWSSIPSRCAACVTWPAICSARDCASEPSVSASSR